jgi:hypothetical protein
MPSPSIELLTRLVGPAILVALGIATARNGPQGYVHGLGDWRRAPADIQRRAGHTCAHALYAMAALLATHALYVYRFHPDPPHRQLATLAMVAGLAAATAGMLLRLAALRRQAGRERHGG